MFPPAARCADAKRVFKASTSIILSLALALFAIGCTTTIVPPASVREPASVFLLDHGRTPSLVIPTAEGGMIRYAYGDWRYYALAEKGICRGLAALFWPTQATLGRSAMPGPATIAHVHDQVKVGVEHVYELKVERQAAARLQGKLDDLYQANIASEIVNEDYDMRFVHHPKPYTYLWNSNHAVASWLGELGCDVSGPANASRWRVIEPPHGDRGKADVRARTPGFPLPRE